MYRLTLALLCFVLVLTLSVEGGILCKDDTCSRLECHGEQTKEACDAKGVAGRYKFMERGGMCGCCHKCVKMLNENESCFEYSGGGDQMAYCADNLYCNGILFASRKLELPSN